MQLKDLVTKQDAMGPLLDMGALQASSIMVTLPAPLAGVSLIPRATASPSMAVVIVAGISTKQSSCTGSLHQEEALTFHRNLWISTQFFGVFLGLSQKSGVNLGLPQIHLRFLG